MCGASSTNQTESKSPRLARGWSAPINLPVGQLRVQPAGREGPLLRASQQLSPRGAAASSSLQLRHPNSQDSASESAQLGRAKQGPKAGFVPGPPAPPGLPQAWHPRPGPIQVLILVCLTLRPAVRQAVFGDRTNNRVQNSPVACVGQKTEPPAEPQARGGGRRGRRPHSGLSVPFCRSQATDGQGMAGLGTWTGVLYAVTFQNSCSRIWPFSWEDVLPAFC